MACNRPQGKSRVSPAPCELLTAARHRAAEISAGPNWPGLRQIAKWLLIHRIAVGVISLTISSAFLFGYKSPSLFGTRIPKVPRYFGTHISLLSICSRAEFSALYSTSSYGLHPCPTLQCPNQYNWHRVTGLQPRLGYTPAVYTTSGSLPRAGDVTILRT